jgi:peptide/nickel transport system substrate-binding protein
VREAISYAIDVDAIITSLLGGRGLRADTPIIPGTWAYNAEARMPAHDLGRARDILDEAQWTLPEGNSVRVKNDTELRFSLLTDEDPLRGAVADAIALQLAEAGIEATVVRQPSAALVNDFLIPRQYQAAVYGSDSGADTDPYPGWHSSQAINGGRNIAAYTSDDADALLEEARRTFAVDDRRELYAEFQELFVEDEPSVPLFVPLSTFFISGVENVQIGVLFTPSSRFQNIWEWTPNEGPSIGQ